MLLPKFSLRQYFAVVTAISVISLVVVYAARGHDWAFSLLVSLGTLATTFVVLAVLYVAAAPIAAINNSLRSHAERQPTTPFATQLPPPQIIPPPDPE